MNLFTRFLFFVVILGGIASCQKEVPVEEITAAQQPEEIPHLLQLPAPPAYKSTTDERAKIRLESAIASTSKRAKISLPATPISCSDFFHTGNTANENNDAIFDDFVADYSGNDILYSFVHNGNVSYNYIIDLYGLSADLDIFLLKLDAQTDEILEVLAVSDAAGSAGERIIAELPLGKYGILIDAYQAGISSSYKLALNSTSCGGIDVANTPIFTNITEATPGIIKWQVDQQNDPLIDGTSGNQYIQIDRASESTHFLDARIGTNQVLSWEMRIASGKNAYISIEKQAESGAEAFCHLYFSRQGQIWVFVQNQWFLSSRTFTPEQWFRANINFQWINGSRLQFYADTDNDFPSLFNNDFADQVLDATSNIQYNSINKGTAGEWSGVGFHVYDQHTNYQLREFVVLAISPIGDTGGDIDIDIGLIVN